MDPFDDKKLPDFFSTRTQLQADTEDETVPSEELQIDSDNDLMDEVPYDFRAEYKDKIERTFGSDDEEEEKKFSSVRLHAIGIGVLIGVLVALLASVLLFGSDDEEASEPIVVAESQRPVKVRPTNPGGMDIPDQDKTIYNRMRSDEVDTKVERLVVVDEVPVRPQVPTKEGEILGKPQDISSEKMELEVLSVQKKAVQVPAPKPQIVKEEPVEVKKEVTEEKPVEKPKAKETPKTQKMSANEWHVQLISLPSKSSAEKAWPKILKAHSALLSGLPHDIAEVQIKGKGTFYRLRVGSFKDKKDAQSLCTKLKARKQDCTLTK